MKIEIVVPLPSGDSGLQHCIVRFHNRNMDSKRKDKTRFFRRCKFSGFIIFHLFLLRLFNMIKIIYLYS